MLPDRGVTVNRLRIRSRVDPMTARLRAGWLLDESALQPPGLSPSAILCIRRLTDPRPGTIALERAERPPREWSDSVNAAIAALARKAERPARGDAAGTGEAVMFADRAELLACLAAEWCAGRLASRWWARELLKDLDGRGLVRAWLDTPVHIAAAFDELAHRGAAAAFVERLSPSDTRAFLDAVVVHHGLRRLASAVEPLTVAQPASTATIDARSRGTSSRSTRAQAIDARPRVPWGEFVAASVSRTLRADQQCLLGIALTIRRAAVVARSERFAEDVQQWCAQAVCDFPFAGRAVSPLHRLAPVDRGTAADVRRTDEEPASDPQTHRKPSASSLAQPMAVDPRDGHANGQSTTVRSTASMVIQAAARAPAVEDTPSPAQRPSERESSTPLSNESPQRDAAGASTAPSPVARSTDQITPSPPPPTIEVRTVEPDVAPHARDYPQAVETRLGGVFYVINVAIGLGLYGDFTMPMKPGLELSIWDFLALAARRMTPPHFEGDALWALLADLARRARGEDAAVVKEMQRRAAPWIRWVVPFVRARLARSGVRIGRRRAGTLLCVHDATIFRSATHLDVMFSLADLPIAIRASGLDRNPGWVPAADRVIAFHFD